MLAVAITAPLTFTTSSVERKRTGSANNVPGGFRPPSSWRNCVRFTEANEISDAAATPINKRAKTPAPTNGSNRINELPSASKPICSRGYRAKAYNAKKHQTSIAFTSERGRLTFAPCDKNKKTNGWPLPRPTLGHPALQQYEASFAIITDAPVSYRRNA